MTNNGTLYRIECPDLETFTKLLVDLMKEGVGYTADAEWYTIELLGSY